MPLVPPTIPLVQRFDTQAGLPLQSVLCSCEEALALSVHVQWHDRLLPDHNLDASIFFGRGLDKLPTWLARQVQGVGAALLVLLLLTYLVPALSFLHVDSRSMRRTGSSSTRLYPC